MRRLLPALFALAAACGSGSPGPKERITIPPGATLHAIADSLAAHGVISSPRWFSLVARIGRYDRRLKSGPYELTRGEGARSALRALVSGHAILTRLTVPEGFTLSEVATTVEKSLGIPREQFLARARDSELLREYGVTAPSFEGFLLPETYLFAPGVSAETVLRTLAEASRRAWDSTWAARAAEQGLDRPTTLILASLVEGEARVDSDRPLVAGVYRNRVRLGMPLQADPTVQYAIELKTGERKTRLFEKDYGVDSPYNTYLHPGLPPGPVGMPGRRSIEAVLRTPEVPYLYFVAGPDGAHIFSRTYAEHLRTVRRVQQEARRNPRGAP
jgi:UPF0755 protein